MRGSVVKRGGTWSAVVDAGPDPLTGKRRQKWHSGYRTKKDAEQAVSRLVTAINDGTYVEPTRQTVADFAREWLAAIEPTVRPATHYSYKRNLELHVVPSLGSRKVVQVDAGTLHALYAQLLANGRSDGAGGLSARSVRYVHTICHRMFKDAVRWGRLARNPADAADPPQQSATPLPELQTWPAPVLADFLDRSRESDDRYFAAWHFLASTGMRRGEALGLRWSDVDLDAGRASIVQTVIAVKHEVSFGTPKTAKGRRHVALDTDTVGVLCDHRRRQLEERLLIGSGWRDHDLVFCKVDGDPLHPERFSREFDRRVARWELPKLTLHGLRHTWATLALQAGVHPKVVSERLGHANISITLDTYSHVTPTMQTDAAETVARLIRGT